MVSMAANVILDKTNKYVGTCYTGPSPTEINGGEVHRSLDGSRDGRSTTGCLPRYMGDGRGWECSRLRPWESVFEGEAVGVVTNYVYNHHIAMHIDSRGSCSCHRRVTGVAVGRLRTSARCRNTDIPSSMKW